MKINVAKVLAREKERKAEELRKPPPKVRIGKRSPIAERIMAETPPEIRQKVREYSDALVEKTNLLKELDADHRRLMKERAVLSTQLARMVNDIQERLKDEPGALEAFMSGELPMPELAAHVAKIEALTDRGAELYDDIDYVEQHGKRPPSKIQPITVQEDSVESNALQYEIRRLDDRIHKTKKKLSGKPAKPSRMAMWNEKVAMDEAHRNELKRKLKNLQYESRAQRTSEE